MNNYRLGANFPDNKANVCFRVKDLELGNKFPVFFGFGEPPTNAHN